MVAKKVQALKYLTRSGDGRVRSTYLRNATSDDLPWSPYAGPFLWPSGPHALPPVSRLFGTGKLFFFRSLQLPADAWMRMFIPHASITFINIDSNGIVSMTRFGDSGHFPPDKVTY